MSGQVTITQLPSAAALTGSESVPIVQNGVTVQTTTGAISGAGALNYPFLTVGSTSGLTQARYVTVGAGLTTVDGGAGTTFSINMTGAAASLNSASNGFIVKTATNTVLNRSIAVGSGMTISNADGISGNPTLGLSTNLQNLSSLSGTGLMTINGTTFSQVTLQGTSNQITITNPNASTGSPTFSIASNPTLPGNSFVQLPAGTNAQRGSPVYGAFRYNNDIQSLEVYNNLGWNTVAAGTGVVTFSAGTTGFTPSTPTAGGIILDGVLNSANGGTGASGTLTGYVYGNGISPMTASITIPTTDLSGTISNAQLSNSAITINGNSVSLGSSTTVTASTTSSLTIGTGLSGTSFNGSTPVTIALANSGVTTGTYGSSAVIPVITVNAQGQVTSISTQATNAPAFQSTWNATTNSPTLTSSVGTQGNYYVVSVAGNTTLNGVSGWNVGDWAIFQNGVWDKIPGSTTESFTNLITTNLQVGGLTGYMYANNTTGNVSASTTIPTTALSGTITNAQLANSSVTIGSSVLSLGGTLSTLAGVTISGATNTLTNIGNSSLTNSAVTINGSSVSLGGSVTVTATATNALTIGTGLSGTSYNGSTAVTIANTGVLSFSAGTTGLTPSTATTGAVTLGGTLNVGNGGIGVATLSGIAYGNGTSAFTAATAAQVVSVIGSTAVTNSTNAANVAVTTGVSNNKLSLVLYSNYWQFTSFNRY